MREAIFSIVGQDLDGYSFLDAFGGSGIMGVEAYSRGARPVLINEKNPRSFRAIQRSIRDLDISIDIRAHDARRVISSARWDLIFLDPPYSFSIQPYIQISCQHSNWLVIAEMDHKASFETVAGWSIQNQKLYGTSMLVVFEKDRDIDLLSSSEDSPQ